ncbi:MAG TPA: hypothetical protein DEB39_11420 [Planctomycetaceae bacterium]|nr:hypothetical protein [Planctomycetaceae bacterium]
MKTNDCSLLRIFFVALSILCGSGILPSRAAGAEEATSSLRVLCYNIKHGQGMDGVVDLERTVEAIRKWRPDVVLVQEVDKNTRRTSNTDQPKILAERLGMYYIFGKTIDYQNGEYGLLTLSRFPILEHEMILLPPATQQEQRGVLIAKIALPGTNGKIIRLANTHLSAAMQNERTVQAARIDEILSKGHEPVILAGDFNARPANELIVRLLKNWKDSADPETYKSIEPDTPERLASRIDFIFLRAKDAFDVSESGTIPDKTTSDHMPIFSVISLN